MPVLLLTASGSAQDFDTANDVRKQRAAVDEAFAQLQVRLVAQIPCLHLRAPLTAWSHLQARKRGVGADEESQMDESDFVTKGLSLQGRLQSAIEEER